MRHVDVKKRMSMVDAVRILSRYVNEEWGKIRPGGPGSTEKTLILTAIIRIVESRKEKHPEWYGSVEKIHYGRY